MSEYQFYNNTILTHFVDGVNFWFCEDKIISSWGEYQEIVYPFKDPNNIIKVGTPNTGDIKLHWKQAVKEYFDLYEPLKATIKMSLVICP